MKRSNLKPEDIKYAPTRKPYQPEPDQRYTTVEGLFLIGLGLFSILIMTLAVIGAKTVWDWMLRAMG